jgi:cold shock protein
MKEDAMKKATVELAGPVKWYDASKGYGFIVSESGDVFVHHSTLRPHGRRSVPEGATLVVEAYLSGRGLQTEKVLSIDLSSVPPPRQARPTELSHDQPGEFEPLEVKWFDENKGYGFLLRGGEDIFLHAQVVRAAGLQVVWMGDWVEARVASGAKGLIAVEMRQPVKEAKAA